MWRCVFACLIIVAFYRLNPIVRILLVVILFVRLFLLFFFFFVSVLYDVNARSLCIEYVRHFLFNHGQFYQNAEWMLMISSFFFRLQFIIAR